MVLFPSFSCPHCLVPCLPQMWWKKVILMPKPKQLLGKCPQNASALCLTTHLVEGCNWILVWWQDHTSRVCTRALRKAVASQGSVSDSQACGHATPTLPYQYFQVTHRQCCTSFSSFFRWLNGLLASESRSGVVHFHFLSPLPCFGVVLPSQSLLQSGWRRPEEFTADLPSSPPGFC